MGDNFFIRVETMHLNDRGTTENVRLFCLCAFDCLDCSFKAHQLSPEELEKREVVHINIADDQEFLLSAVCKHEIETNAAHRLL